MAFSTPIYDAFETREGRSQQESFEDGFDLVQAADTWGLDGVWRGEMHFNPAALSSSSVPHESWTSMTVGRVSPSVG